jgi:hypothetical protein
MREPIRLTNSEIFMWQRCPRMWLLTYYLGYTPDADDVTGNRILGIRVHCALQGYYGYELDPLTVLHVLYQLALEAFPDYEAELLAERDLASAMVEGYLEWITTEGKDATLTCVATEAEVIVPLPGVPGVELMGKLDQVVLDDATGLLSFLDHKTAASFERHELLAISPQFRYYSLLQKLAVAGHQGAPRVMGGFVNTLRRVKRTSKAVPPFYQRDPFRYNEEMINSTLLKVTGIAKKIVAARGALDWIYTEGGGDLTLLNAYQATHLPHLAIETDCSWRCPFLALCPMLDDGSDWVGALTRSGHYRQQDPHAYYADDPLRQVREVLAGQQG